MKKQERKKERKKKLALQHSNGSEHIIDIPSSFFSLFLPLSLSQLDTTLLLAACLPARLDSTLCVESFYLDSSYTRFFFFFSFFHVAKRAPSIYRPSVCVCVCV